MYIAGTNYTSQQIQDSQLLKDIKKQKLHIPKKLMNEVYELDANPRYVTLCLFLQYNYRQYDNDVDKLLVWDMSHLSNDRVSDILIELYHQIK